MLVNTATGMQMQPDAAHLKKRKHTNQVPEDRYTACTT